MNDTVRLMLRAARLLQPNLHFQYRILEWIDDFLIIVSTNKQELEDELVNIFQEKLRNFGLTDEDPKEYVGLKLLKTKAGFTTCASNPNEQYLRRQDFRHAIRLKKRRFQNALGSAPAQQQRALVKSQLIRCLDCSMSVRRAVETMHDLCKELYTMGYGKHIESTWTTIATTYPYLQLQKWKPSLGFGQEKDNRSHGQHHLESAAQTPNTCKYTVPGHEPLPSAQTADLQTHANTGKWEMSAMKAYFRSRVLYFKLPPAPPPISRRQVLVS